MVTIDDMSGEPTEIIAFAIMPSEYSQKTGSYYDFSLKFGYTELNELSVRYSENWLTAPLEVFSDSQLELTNVVGGEWLTFEFDEPFIYDASANLLLEMSWNGPIDPPDSRIYAMSWEDAMNRALVASDVDAEVGYVTTMLPHMLFITSAEALEQSTFAGIKSSF